MNSVVAQLKLVLLMNFSIDNSEPLTPHPPTTLKPSSALKPAKKQAGNNFGKRSVALKAGLPNALLQEIRVDPRAQAHVEVLSAGHLILVPADSVICLELWVMSRLP